VCVVLAREETPDDKRLVAYVEPQAGSSPTPSDLREHLKRKLPNSMLPAAFVMVEKLPLTPNGKIDRRALPRSENIVQAHKEAVYVAPRDAIELHLARLWSKVLALERVGIHDNFFDLGGHSLLA